MEQLRIAFIFAALVVFAGCPLFHDHAAPPVIDRLDSIASVDSEFGSLRGRWADMHVLSNGEREFVLIHADGKDGFGMTAAYDASLSLENDAIGYGELRVAFPDAPGGDFILEVDRYAGEDFSFVQADVYSDGFPFSGERRFTAIPANGTVRILSVPDDTDDSQLEVGREYSTDWPSDETGDDGSVAIARDPESGEEPPEALTGFELYAAYHLPDPQADATTTGLILYNDTLDSTYVVELTDAVAQEIQSGNFTEDYLEDRVAVIQIGDAGPERVAYTARGIVVFEDEEHIVYRTDGSERARMNIRSNGEFRYAYAPDGRHWYMLSLEQSRLYRMRAWW